MRYLKYLICAMLLIVLSACSGPSIQPTQAPKPSNTPKIVINIGPPGAGEGVPKNPFEGTPLPPVQGRSPTDPPREVVMDVRVAYLPMIDNQGLPAVDVTINGAGPYRFVVDWGANLFAMSPKLAAELNLPILGVDEMGNPNARVDSLAIGPAQFRDLTVALDPFFLQTGEDGVLGRNIYEKLLITLDYPAHRIHLEEGSLPAADEQSTFKFISSEGGAPMLEMHLQDHSFLVVLDTGAARGLILPASEAGNYSFTSGPVSGGAAVGPQLGTAGTLVGRLEGDLTFGDFTIRQPVAVILERPEYLLGSAILKYFAVTLDQQQGLVRLERQDGSPVVIPPEAWENTQPTP